VDCGDVRLCDRIGGTDCLRCRRNQNLDIPCDEPRADRTPKPDISSPEALRRTLLAAKSIVYTDPAVGGASGIQFEKVIDNLGIAKEIKAKSILNARAATKPSAEFVARGEAELGVQLISEIVSVPGAELLGPLPTELQTMNVISAGIVTTAREPDAA